MDWKLLYQKLVESAKSESRTKDDGVYYERHHIIPKHMGGGNDKDNLVLLTFREHIIAHYLLWRIYRRRGDRVMWMFRSGQTEEAQVLRSKLAVEANRTTGKGFQNWEGEKHPMRDPEKVKRALNTKKRKYGGGIMSEEAKSAWLPRLTSRMREMAKDPEIQAKRSNTIKEINSKLTLEEYAKKYNNAGENNGNYGWIKGYYEVLDPHGNSTRYESQDDIISKLGVSQSFLIRNRNKGACYTPPKKNAGKWNGWIFNYYKLPCPTTGRVQKEHKTHKK
jgi:hypothetical protein